MFSISPTQIIATLFVHGDHLIILPFTVSAQTITGKVVSSASKTGVAKASVFLNNATFGTATEDDGTFSLRGVKPGQYDLIVSVLGFEEYTEKVQVGVQRPINLIYRLPQK
jgi:hypothetical protein